MSIRWGVRLPGPFFVSGGFGIKTARRASTGYFRGGLAIFGYAAYKGIVLIVIGATALTRAIGNRRRRARNEEPLSYDDVLTGLFGPSYLRMRRRRDSREEELRQAAREGRVVRRPDRPGATPLHDESPNEWSDRR